MNVIRKKGMDKKKIRKRKRKCVLEKKEKNNWIGTDHELCIESLNGNIEDFLRKKRLHFRPFLECQSFHYILRTARRKPLPSFVPSLLCLFSHLQRSTQGYRRRMGLGVFWMVLVGSSRRLGEPRPWWSRAWMGLGGCCRGQKGIWAMWGDIVNISTGCGKVQTKRIWQKRKRRTAGSTDRPTQPLI